MAFKVRRSTLPLLPKGSRDITILHFSDLHLRPGQKRKIADIKSFITLKPDLVISTGDLLAHEDSVGPVINALDELLDLPGFFVFGSNDYHEPKFKNPFTYLKKYHSKQKFGNKLPWQSLQKKLTERGWKDLTHNKVKVKVNGVMVEARGTDDAHLDLDNYPLVSGAKSKSTLVSIGVTHAPYARVLAAMASDRLDLIFSGHTHGGQVRLPWLRGSKSLTTNCDLENWRSRGLTRVNNEPWLNVSAGIGMSPYAPIRFACPPEISLVTLTALYRIKE
jgi:predicted MPP superfamily phosphohydrolase